MIQIPDDPIDLFTGLYVEDLPPDSGEPLPWWVIAFIGAVISVCFFA